MNHRKNRSQGYIPFSWEEKPGIPKFINHQKSKSSPETTIGSSDIDSLIIVSPKNEGSASDDTRAHLLRSVPPPPAPPQKSSSGKFLRRQEDPFIAALKSCMKGDEKKEKSFGKSSLFSCKESCNVRDDNLVKFSKLPPLPKERYYTRSFVRNLK